MKKIGILGSTGSIGTQALEVIRNFFNYRVQYLSCFSNYNEIIKQAKEFRPKKVCIIDSDLEKFVKKELNPEGIEVLSGYEGLYEISKESVDLMLNSIIGADGMESSIIALDNDIPLALANKESVVMAGWIIRDIQKKKNSTLIPVDSEHSAIFQCLLGERNSNIKRILLTGSGGPFRSRDFKTFDKITLNEALCHPNWSMGNKITIDSATMMNKGLEFIEAYWLFGVKKNMIDIVIHPESIIHSMVEFTDGSIKAQMGNPDMKVPIRFSLSYPERCLAESKLFSFSENNSLSFEQVDLNKFPCIKIAQDALSSGGSHQVVLNIANDYAVSEFLKGEISFLDIHKTIDCCINKHQAIEKPTLDEIRNISIWTKEYIKKEFFT
tara:strand:+ start:12509 stop:13654 length:1146 start_codon:yes stop_codon:yes gene_type:complete